MNELDISGHPRMCLEYTGGGPVEAATKETVKENENVNKEVAGLRAG